MRTIDAQRLVIKVHQKGLGNNTVMVKTKVTLSSTAIPDKSTPPRSTVSTKNEHDCGQKGKSICTYKCKKLRKYTKSMTILYKKSFHARLMYIQSQPNSDPSGRQQNRPLNFKKLNFETLTKKLFEMKWQFTDLNTCFP